jgi:hypothetical protein
MRDAGSACQCGAGGREPGADGAVTREWASPFCLTTLPGGVGGLLPGAAILVWVSLRRTRPLSAAGSAEPDPSMRTVAERPDCRPPASAERYSSAPGRDRPPILGSDLEVAAHDQRAVLIYGHYRAGLPGNPSLCASISHNGLLPEGRRPKLRPLLELPRIRTAGRQGRRISASVSMTDTESPAGRARPPSSCTGIVILKTGRTCISSGGRGNGGE